MTPEMGSLDNLFRYEPLDSGAFSIRVLRLLKSRAERIHCHVFKYNLSQGPSSYSVPLQYEALSYAWGSDERVERIIVNKRIMWITASLYAALRGLRSRHRDRLLWIDAICINQADTKERNRQVRRMKDIYQRANRVIFWLGSSVYETTILLKMLRRLQAILPNPDSKVNSWSDISQNQDLIPAAHRETLIRQCSKGLLSLLSQPWFERIWILQEVANARQAIVCSGKYFVSAHMFTYAASQMNLPAGLKCGPVLDLMPGPTRIRSSPLPRQDIGSLIVKFRHSKASDERDRIYALLGMSSGPATESTTVNYADPVQDVVYDWMRTLVNDTNIAIHELLNILTAFTTLNSVLVIWPSNLEKDVEVLHCTTQTGHRVESGDMNHDFTAQKFFLSRSHISILTQQRNASVAGDGNDCYRDVVGYLDGQHEADWNYGGFWTASWGLVDETVKLLIIKDPVTALNIALDDGCIGIANMLFSTNNAGNYIFTRDKPSLKTLLGYAVCYWYGHDSSFGRLVENEGADVNVKNRWGRTPLHEAVDRGIETMVRVLVERANVDINAKTPHNETPLSLAARKGNVSNVQILLARDDIEVNSKDIDGWTPLFSAMVHNNEAVVKKLLKMDKINTHPVDDFNRTPLHYAAERGNFTSIERLQKIYGIDSNKKDYDGHTALHLAAKYGHEAVVQLLLLDKSTMIMTDNNGRAPLHLAALEGHEAAVKALLEKDKTEINMADNVGWTPLYLAVNNAKDEAAKILLEEEENDMKAKSATGWESLHLTAASRRREEVMDLLRKAHARKVNDSIQGEGRMVAVSQP